MLPWVSSTLLAIVPADPPTKHAATLCVPKQHPALAGHFPGNPIVPGVMILDAVISAAQTWLGTAFHVERLAYAKFLAPLKPEETVQIDLLRQARRLEFVVHRGGTALAKGAFDCFGELAT
jgi:3-hydroxymyristoyl/3-hydroxydecanoyl-(acyl carrier protein) dehydratase